MTALPRNVSKFRTAAFFHLKSAAALVESDSCSDKDLETAIAIISRATARLEDFARERFIHISKQEAP